jgi:MYXO-CTERM domain-containing protein
MCDGDDNDCDEAIDEGCEVVSTPAPAVGGCGCDSGANAAGFVASFGALLAARTRRRR